jgi:hypothetical protein
MDDNRSDRVEEKAGGVVIHMCMSECFFSRSCQLPLKRKHILAKTQDISVSMQMKLGTVHPFPRRRRRRIEGCMVITSGVHLFFITEG